MRIEAKRIAVAIASVVPDVDPELVVLGVGSGATATSFWSRSNASSADSPHSILRIEVSSLGQEAELRGAVSTALQAAQERLFRRGATEGAAM